MKNPTFILSADWHLREDTPICRTDDFQETQRKTLAFIGELSNNLALRIIVAGDVFHKAKPSLGFVSRMSEECPWFHSIPGNHDLPGHNINNLDQSAYHVLTKTGNNQARAQQDRIFLEDVDYPNIKIYCPIFNTPLEDVQEMYVDASKCNILIYHYYTYMGRCPIPGLISDGCNTLTKKLPQFDLILTGDNHQSFTHYNKETDTRLVNPGSITRQTADQKDFKPCVYIWSAESGEVETIPLPDCHPKDVTRQHIESAEQKEKRLSVFVDRLKEDIEVGLSFKNNLTEFMKSNKVVKPIQNKVWEAVE